MHHNSDRFRQIADPFSKTSRFWNLFTQWVCSLATTPPQTANSPPPNGGNCIIRAATRRRYPDSQLLMLQNPHHSQPEVRRIVYKSLAQHRLVRITSPSTAPPPAFPRTTRPARHKTPILGHFSYAWRTLYRCRQQQATHGELFRAQDPARGNFATNDTSAATDAGQHETIITTAHPQQGNAETDIATAPENCTKNAHFSPAKATAVEGSGFFGPFVLRGLF